MELTLPTDRPHSLARDDSRLVAPRDPSGEMLDAFVHIAFGSWTNAWQVRDGAARVHWALVVHDIRTGPRVSVNTFGVTHPMELMLAEIHGAVAAARGGAWVIVPKKRTGLAARLQAEGIPVSIGLTEENRAAAVLIETIATESGRQHRDAMRAGLVHPSRGVQTRRIQLRRTRPLDPPIRHWWPRERRVRASSRGTLVLAADASLDAHGGCGLAVVTDGGDMAAMACHSRAATGELELRALTLALELLRELTPSRVEIISDSVDAVSVARALSAGVPPAQGYRGISEQARADFVAALRLIGCSLSFVLVRGHTGHRLNEAADELANLVRRATTHPRESIEAELARRIDAVLRGVTHRAGLPPTPGEVHCGQ